MSWREVITAYAARRSLPCIDLAQGIGIEFADGCDVFWLLPGEVTSTIPMPPGDSVDPSHVIAEFERIDRLRTSVLHVIRHNLAEQNFYVGRCQSGEWGVMAESGIWSSTLSVGPIVTVGAVEGLDVYRLVARWHQNTIFGKPPSKRRIDRYLSTEGAPANERPIPDKTPTIAGLTTVRAVLVISGICKVLENTANLSSPERLKEALVPSGRIAKALLRVGDRLPQVNASWVLESYLLTLDFDDREDSYSLNPKSRNLAELVRSQGVEAAGDRIADEYLRLNAGRTAVLNAVKRAVLDRGWSVERRGPWSKRWFLGNTHREVELRVGAELTESLRVGSPEQAIRQLLTPHPIFAEECVAALTRSDAPGALTERDLAPALPTRRPKLRSLDADTIAALDAFADRTLDDYLRDEQTIWVYRWSNRFDSSCDNWATQADWIRLAERLIDRDSPNPAAIVVLLDANDPRGMERARYLLDRLERHHEAPDAGVELVWRFRHERPDLARTWFTTQPGEPVPFVDVRAELGDPVARRYLSALHRFKIDDETTWTSRANPSILGLQPSSEVRDRVQRHLLEWARTSWRWSPPDLKDLQKALWLDLTDVVHAFDANPYLTNGLLCGDRAHVGLDEPGILRSASFLLAWSQIQPTPLLGQIVATAHLENVLAEADRVVEESAQRDPTLRKNIESWLRMYRRLHHALQIPLAITWKRYRQFFHN